MKIFMSDSLFQSSTTGLKAREKLPPSAFSKIAATIELMAEG
jgi:hypothetical protein